MSTTTAAAPKNWYDLNAPSTATNLTTKKDLNTDPTAQKEMFLQLLVAQIKNQNPLNPSDGTQFVAQLSQMTGVEQLLGMRQDLKGIQSSLTEPAAPPTNGPARLPVKTLP
ncbi:MAG: hypothetical protein NTV70_24885 [Acidobacteria bacterium]|nr:hypothetical protein [Acidobacteriota bacterium]